MDYQRKLRSEQETQEQEHLAEQQKAKTESVQEFATVEELLRHDALHTPVPPSVEHRLEKSLSQCPPPARPWWRRWFKG